MGRAMVMTVVVLSVTWPGVSLADGKTVVMLSRRGQALWHKSCIGQYLASCVTLTRVSGRKPSGKGGQCAAGTALRARRRNPARARAAQKLFANALSHYEKLGHKPPAVVVEAAAAARFHQAEVQFEAYLGIRYPSILASTNIKRADKRLRDYLSAKGAALSRTRAAYQGVIKMKATRWAVASSARIGQLFQHFADEQSQALVPRIPVPGEYTTRATINEYRQTFADTFCNIMERKARPLASKARQAFRVCAQRATAQRQTSDFAAYCRDQIKRRRP